MTFGTMKVVGRQPYAPAVFTPRSILVLIFLEAQTTPGHMVPSAATEKIPSTYKSIGDKSISEKPSSIT